DNGLADHGDAGGGVGPGLARVEQAVVVTVAALVDGDHAGMVVGDGQIGEGDVAGVADQVSPGHGRADDQQGASAAVVIGAVGQLDQAEPGLLGCGGHGDGGGVVGQVRVELVGVADDGRVGFGGGAGHLGVDGEDLGGPGGDRAEGPQAGGRVIAALG